MEEGHAIRVALADDSFLMREAIQQVLARLARVNVVAVCGHGEELLAAVGRERAAVVITDVRMPPSGDQEGIRVARALRQSHPDVGVVVLSQYAEPRYGFGLLEGGAGGRAYLLKDRVGAPAELMAAIEVVARGGSMIDPHMVALLMGGPAHPSSALGHLTTREREVLAHMAEGKSNAAIAGALVLTKRAVEKHVGAIFTRLDLKDQEDVSRRVVAVLMYLAEQDDLPAA